MNAARGYYPVWGIAPESAIALRSPAKAGVQL
jgi:hypothetical protein